MKSFLSSRGRACLLGVLLLLPMAWAHAQASRTWVSGVGDDVNPCSRTAPCRSLAGALAKTASGGEIDVLDAAALDGSDDDAVPVVAPSTLTIDKPITIDGGGGRAAGYGGVSLGDSIVINLAAPGMVVLRNLQLNGFAGTGSNGVRVLSNTNVVLDHVDISGYAQNCLLVDAGASGALIDVSYSVFSNCRIGVANRAAATVNLGDDSTVVLNTVAGVSSNNPQGAVYFFNTSPQNNTQNTNFSSYVSGTGATLSGGGVGCAFASQQFVAPTGIGGTLPSTVVGVAGAGFQFTSTNCGGGATVTITLTYAQAMPANTVLYKYGPATPGAGTSTWFPVPGASLSADGKTFTYSLTDNGVGDSNAAVGFIDDPVLPVVPEPQTIPTLSEWGLLLLAALMLGLVAVEQRRRRRA